jgi:hypothetical protein
MQEKLQHQSIQIGWKLLVRIQERGEPRGNERIYQRRHWLKIGVSEVWTRRSCLSGGG